MKTFCLIYSSYKLTFFKKEAYLMSPFLESKEPEKLNFAQIITL